MRGARPKPTALKLIQGNPGKRPLNRNEPQPPVSEEIPEPPEHLNDDAKEEWARLAPKLHKIGLLSEVDYATFAAYCQAYGIWTFCERAIKKAAEGDPDSGGMMIKTSNGNLIQNPMVGAANRAKKDMVRIAAEFGMTPSARSRVIAGHGQTPPPTPERKKTGTNKEDKYFD